MNTSVHEYPAEILQRLSFSAHTEYPLVLRRMRDASADAAASPIFYRAVNLALIATFAYVPGTDAIWVAHADVDLSEHGFRDVTEQFTRH